MAGAMNWMPSRWMQRSCSQCLRVLLDSGQLQCRCVIEPRCAPVTASGMHRHLLALTNFWHWVHIGCPWHTIAISARTVPAHSLDLSAVRCDCCLQPGAPTSAQQGVLPALFSFQLGPGQGYVEALTPEQQHQVWRLSADVENTFNSCCLCGDFTMCVLHCWIAGVDALIGTLVACWLALLAVCDLPVQRHTMHFADLYRMPMRRPSCPGCC